MSVRASLVMAFSEIIKKFRGVHIFRKFSAKFGLKNYFYWAKHSALQKLLDPGVNFAAPG